jgi:hypothetical protein
MSTLQDSPPHHSSIRTRWGAGLVAAGALIAIVVSILFLSLTSAHRNTAATTTSGAISGTLPAAVAAPSSTSTFRDPVTHALLRVPTAAGGTTEPRAEHSQGRIVP